MLSITAVISAELMNTAVERTCNLIAELDSLGQDPRIRDMKDLAAAVLVVAMGTAANGVTVFGTRLI